MMGAAAYGLCALVGAVFGGGVCLGGVWLYGQLDDVRGWSRTHDALSKAGVYVGAVLVSCLVGAVCGLEVLDGRWVLGALVGGSGGVLGVAGLFGKVQAAAGALLDRRAASL